MSTRAIILAAGQGVRLRPLTDERPKCLVELDGVPLLQRQAASLAACGLKDITVVTGYRSESIEQLGYQSVRNPRVEETNMVWSLFCARDLFDGDKHILVSYGDIVCEPRVIQAVLTSNQPLNVVVDLSWRSYWELRSADPLADAETLRMDPDGRLLELGKRPRTLDEIQAQYIGLFKVHRDHVRAFLDTYDRMDRALTYDGRPFEQMFMTSFIQFLIDTDWPVYAVPVSSGWLEVDTLEDIDLYHGLLGRGELDRLYRCQAF